MYSFLENNLQETGPEEGDMTWKKAEISNFLPPVNKIRWISSMDCCFLMLYGVPGSHIYRQIWNRK